jgi:4-hydroxy-tetrahydrodipicolinate synthase
MPDLGAVLTAIVTPFDERNRINEESFVALLRRLAEHGSDGFVVAGTTGEASTLTDEEQLGLIGLAVAERPEGKTVIAGTGTNDTRHAVHLTERATELGADAVLVVTPYYNRPSRRGLVRHYQAVASATDKPTILYNIPSRTGTNMPPELLAELAQIDGIDGLKQSNEAEMQLIDGLAVFAGNDDLVARTLDLGGAGGICVSSHVIGPEMKRLFDDPEGRAELDASLADVYAAMFCTASPAPVKAALKLLGHRVGGLRLPMVEVDDEELETVRSVLQAHGLLTGATA